MKNRLSALKRFRFLLLLLLCFLALDTALGVYFDSYVLRSNNFRLNDYEITRRDHPEAVWDKVFFGNSAVISGYREDQSSSGYLNFGVDYGSMTALEHILESGEVNIGSDLVVGLNWAALFDNMETNPGYFWNRGPFTPYSYFQRDRLQTAFTGKLSALATGTPWATGALAGQTKSYYYGTLSDEALQEKVAVYEERYWSTGLAGCADNLQALRRVAAWCEQADIRLRVVLMPWNPVTEKPAVITQLDDAVTALCREANLPLLDLSDRFDASCFYDLGHMNFEYGSYKLTEVLDTWLTESDNF